MSEIDPAATAAAAQRADRLRALEAELEGYERYGRTERAAAVREQIARIKGTPTERRTAPKATAEAASDDAPAKPRRTRKG